MEDAAKRWLFDPTVGKAVTVVIGLLLLMALVRFAQRSLSRYVKDSDTRYRTRKFVTFAGYLAAVFFVGLVFSDKLGGLTVARSASRGPVSRSPFRR